MKRVLLPPTLLAALSLAPLARSDATVVTRAMTATTICEVFVEQDQIRFQIEIGVADLEAFGNLLPDEVRERMGLAPEPLQDRLQRFFSEDCVVRADDGEPLGGRVMELVGRRRLVRDEITGNPLPNQPADADVVVYAEIVYPLEGHPATLSLQPPRGSGAGASANIGFVLYHEGLPVNDFRYLSAEETVDLDWEDPWYTKFRNKNLWRQYEAPMSAFLYVEPFEVRKEVVVRPRDLQQWIDLGLAGEDIIRAAEWGSIKQKVVDFLLTRCPVTVDGQRIEPVLDRVHFIERTLRTSRVIEEPRDLPLVSATLGVIISYPTNGLPQTATMEWELFLDRAPRIPSSAVDEAGGIPTVLTREDNVLRWQNFLKNPTRAKIVELDPPPAPRTLSLPLASILCALGSAVAVFATRKKHVGRIAGAVLLIAAIGLWPFARVRAAIPFTGAATLTEDEVAVICGDLLRNVYRAFDYRAESDIYDVLARSTDGELLTEVYLETRRALELENQGGARARVQEVEIAATDTSVVGDGPGFLSRCTWTVAGSVGHWGHIHQRLNRYEAKLTVEPVDGAWKITGLELLEEVRL